MIIESVDLSSVKDMVGFFLVLLHAFTVHVA